MKKVAFGAMLLSLGIFVTGCNDTAKQKQSSERTVTTDKQTGETTVKEQEKHTEKDTDTGANVDTSVEKETKIKPPQDNVNEPDAGTVPANGTTTGDRPDEK